MFLNAVDRNTLQYCGAEMQPSVSTQIDRGLAARRGDRGDAAEAGATGDREDHVGALAWMKFFASWGPWSGR